ncbi:MAG: hypothetical protein V1646_03445 [bacterium]
MVEISLVRSYIKNNYKLLLSITIFLIIFCILGLPWTYWWFNGGDDFNAIFSIYKIKNLKDLFDAMLQGNTGYLTNPTNFITQSCQPNFIAVYFRPLHVLFLTIEYWLFGTNAYLYLLTNVFFHAINTVLLFNVFLWFTNYIPALVAALLFAFHPQIAFRFGAIANIQYYINITFLLCAVIFFKKFLETQKWRYNIFSALLLTASFFTRETMLVMPAIIFISTYLCQRFCKLTCKSNSSNTDNLVYQSNSNTPLNVGVGHPAVSAIAESEGRELVSGLSAIVPQGRRLESMDKLLLITIPSAFAALVYLATRACLYPLNFSQSTMHPTLSSTPLLSTLKNRIPELKVIIYDLFCLSWLPWGCKTIRAILLLLIFSSLLFLFIKTKNKRPALFCFIFTGLLLWPSLIVINNPRYLYEAYPFFLAGILLLFTGCTFKYKQIKPVIIFMGSIFSIFLILFSVENFAARTKKMRIFSSALKQLAANPQIKNRTLCIFAYPFDGLGEHFASILWVMLDNPNIPIYFDSQTMITQHDSNLFKNKKWRLCASDYFDKNYLKITILENGFRLTSLDPQKVAFYPQETSLSIGKTIAHKTELVNGEKLTTDLTLIIDESILHQKPLFIRWDYEKQNFVIYDREK